MKLSQIRAIAVLAWFDGFLPLKRSPFNILSFIASPLTVLFFIYVFAGASKAINGLAGGLIAVTVGSCIVLETEAAFVRLVVKIQDMFVSSPLSPVAYVVGLSIAQIFNGIAGIALFAILLAFYKPISAPQWALIAGALLLTWASISALGFMISTLARDVRDLWVYSPLLNVLLSFLPPVFYPISSIPTQFRFVAYLAPTTYPAQLIQAAVGVASPSTEDLLLAGVEGIAYTLILILISVKLARWREK